MANSRESPAAQRRRRPQVQRDKERSLSIKKEEPQGTRRSKRLQAISRLQKSEDTKSEEAFLSPPANKVTKRRMKRKQAQEVGPPSPYRQDQPPSKRPQTSLPSSEVEAGPQAKSNTSSNTADPVETWTQTGRWPSQYFKQDSRVGEDLLKHDSWLEEQMERPPTPVVQYVEIKGMKYPRPLLRAPTSLSRNPSDLGLTGSSDRLPGRAKSAHYRTAKYSTLLATKGSFMAKSDSGITSSSKSMCHSLLQTEQTVPQDSLFRDDLFEKTCENLQDRNEAMVIRDIALLIVPSAQTLATYGATHVNHLFECVNEGWNAAIPFQGTRPQPDYSVGFGRSAFTEQQLKKFNPLIGDILYDSKFTTFFMANLQMYFPFLTCEVKCGATALDNADRQNAHSMTIAVRGVVELYKAVKREKELHREILAFSISHDHQAVRIYGHYALIDGSKVTFYRHPIKKFDFTSEEGKDKWTAYKFTKNVYDVWVPIHLKRICSAIDQLPPDLNFEVS